VKTVAMTLTFVNTASHSFLVEMLLY